MPCGWLACGWSPSPPPPPTHRGTEGSGSTMRDAGSSIQRYMQLVCTAHAHTGCSALLCVCPSRQHGCSRGAGRVVRPPTPQPRPRHTPKGRATPPPSALSPRTCRHGCAPPHLQQHLGARQAGCTPDGIHLPARAPCRYPSYVQCQGRRACWAPLPSPRPHPPPPPCPSVGAGGEAAGRQQGRQGREVLRMTRVKDLLLKT